ncbi:MAG: sigma-70 family RNA polymerase sigma factor [Deltaproteobacteria bacterium]|nr:sigma-70 family RNA polymerase sigma factor [Deltaproteobacteria bacterium]
MEIGFFKKLIKVIVSEDKNYISDKSDEELVNLYTNDGEESAFDEIVSRYSDRIYGFAFRITRNTSDAEEVFQEVFLTLTKKLDTFRGESKFSSWLYRVTVNASYMYLRSQKKHESNISLENYVPYDDKGTLMGRIMDKDWGSRPDIIIYGKEALKIIDESINELPESYRTVFHLRDIDGLSNEEVADILEITVPAVKSRLHRARLFLRDKLSDYFHEWRR